MKKFFNSLYNHSCGRCLIFEYGFYCTDNNTFSGSSYFIYSVKGSNDRFIESYYESKDLIDIFNTI